jgi:hypothetical protein
MRCSRRRGEVFSSPEGGIPAGRALSRPARFIRIQLSKSPVAPADLKTAPPDSFPALREPFPASQTTFPLRRDPFPPGNERRGPRSIAFPALRASHPRGNGPFPGPRIFRRTGNRPCTALISCAFWGIADSPWGMFREAGGMNHSPACRSHSLRGTSAGSWGKAQKTVPQAADTPRPRTGETRRPIAGILTARSLRTNVCTSPPFVQRPLGSIEVSRREDLGIHGSRGSAVVPSVEAGPGLSLDERCGLFDN